MNRRTSSWSCLWMVLLILVAASPSQHAFGQVRTILEGDNYRLEHFASKNTITNESVSEVEKTRIAEQARMVEQAVSGQAKRYAAFKTDYWTREIHEIRQVFPSGDEHMVWRTENLIPIVGVDDPRFGWFVNYAAFQVTDLWNVSNKYYLLCNTDRRVLLLEFREDPTRRLVCREVELSRYGQVFVQNALLYTSTSSETLDVSLGSAGFSFRRCVIDLQTMALKQSLHTTDFLVNPAVLMLWPVYESMITPGLNSSNEANAILGKLALFDQANPLAELDETWARDLDPQARDKLFIKLVNQVHARSNGKTEEVVPFDKTSESGWTPWNLRCVLASWRLLGIHDSPTRSLFEGRTTDEELRHLLGRYYQVILVPRVRRELKSFTREGRLEFAQAPLPRICPMEVDVALALLSKDEDPAVRKAVVKNAWIDPIVLLAMMEEEKDSDVSAALDACRKEVRMMPPEDERPMPPGW